jgi:hypothetical protein
MKICLSLRAVFVAILSVAPLAEARVGDSRLRKVDFIRSAAPSGCPVCGEPQNMGNLPKDLPEGSGLGVSRLHPGVYYSMNDSPTSDIRVTAFKESGSLVASFKLENVHSKQGFGKGGQGDVESWGTGPCSPGEDTYCIFVGDTGHNCARPSEKCNWNRKLYSIMRFAEPETLPAEGAEASIVGERFWFRYPDGVHDAEAMFVTPDGLIYLVTKQDQGESQIFTLPELRLGATVEAKEVGKISPPYGKLLFTGASYKKAGDWHGISLRTYSNIFYYPIGPGQAVEEALKAEPCDLPAGKLVQAEGLGWTADGSGYVTITEAGDGAAPGTRGPILKVECKAPKMQSGAQVTLPASVVLVFAMAMLF